MASESNLGVSGLASGFDWQSVVSQLVAVERSPEQLLQAQQNVLNQQNIALGSIKTSLGVLQNAAGVLKDSAFFDSRIATPSDATLASAKAASGTALGIYNFDVSQLASVAAWKGTAEVSGSLSSGNDVSQLTLSTAPFAQAITAGTFTVNGKQITIATTDTLESVFGQISSATNGGVTASYSAASDKITLAGSGPIILGSGADTSNFLQVAKLSNNGTDTVASAAKLGSVQIKKALSLSNLGTTISDGGSGNGAFTINGVVINFNASSDTLTNVLDRINSSGAGVRANYDSVGNKFTLTNKVTGDIGISVQDGDGSNFLTATGLAGGALTHGTDLLYTVNGGPQLSSRTNSITEDSSGIFGLSVTALNEGIFSVAVAGDTAKIRTGITNFVDEYNKVQSAINTETASSTDVTGKVTSGTLAGDPATASLNSRLRDLVNSTVGGLSGTLQRLESLGFVSNGHDDSLSTTNLSDLDNALATNLSGLKDLFSNSTTGLAVNLNSFLDDTIGDQGSLGTHQTNLTNQATDIDTQISSMENQILVYRQQLITGFVAMEVAQSQINQQLSYLTKVFFNNTSSK